MKKLLAALIVLSSISAHAQRHLQARANCEIEGSSSESQLKKVKFSLNYLVKRETGEVINSQIRNEHLFLVKGIKQPNLADSFLASGLTGYGPRVKISFNELSRSDSAHLLSLMGVKNASAPRKGLKLRAMYFWDYDGEGSGKYGIRAGDVDEQVYEMRLDDDRTFEIKLKCQGQTLG